tara:strand:+ start:245 stop:484 length:240 start_codon:yes stop_codon:yes gene_type:complete
VEVVVIFLPQLHQHVEQVVQDQELLQQVINHKEQQVQVTLHQLVLHKEIQVVLIKVQVLVLQEVEEVQEQQEVMHQVIQ